MEKVQLATEQKVSDWVVDSKDNADEAHGKSIIPSFIRLFVIRRIIFHYTSKHGMNSLDTLVDILPSHNKAGKTLLKGLITVGIKKYINYHYNDKQDPQVIELIMNELIFKQFAKEYEQITCYKHKSNKNNTNNLSNTSLSLQNKQREEVQEQQQTNIVNVNSNKNDTSKSDGCNYNICVDYSSNNNYNCKELLFNTDDLMCKIFQYLRFKNLIKCDFVCSHWLYHTWNLNSVYYINLSTLIENSSNPDDHESVGINNNNNNSNRCMCNVARLWQRVIKARYVVFSSGLYQNIPTNYVLNYISMFTNIETLKTECNENYIPILKIMMQNNKDKIKHFNAMITTESLATDIVKQNTLTPLKLENVKEIVLRGFYKIHGIKLKMYHN